MTKINWNITEQELKQELVSGDNRWHISKTQKGEEESKFFLTNYDLLLTPHGSGPDYKVCFETFIDDCDRFVEKIRNIHLYISVKYSTREISIKVNTRQL